MLIKGFARFTYGVFTLVLLTIPAVAMAAGPPAFYGKVLLEQTPEAVALSGAAVELLTPGADEIRHKSVTDSSGTYAFYGAKPGKYEIRIVYGKKVMGQIADDKVINRSLIEVLEKPTKMRVIKVRMAKQ